MAVVINDFEVEVEPPPDVLRGYGGDEPATPDVPTPQDIERIVERSRERAARLRAD